MAELQRSAMSFRRQGSSGQVFDDKFLKELDKITLQQQQEEQVINPSTVSLTPINTINRSRSNREGRAFRTGKVSPAIDPPSPKLSACGFCSAFAKGEKGRRKPKFTKTRK